MTFRPVRTTGILSALAALTFIGIQSADADAPLRSTAKIAPAAPAIPWACTGSGRLVRTSSVKGSATRWLPMISVHASRGTKVYWKTHWRDGTQAGVSLGVASAGVSTSTTVWTDFERQKNFTREATVFPGARIEMKLAFHLRKYNCVKRAERGSLWALEVDRDATARMRDDINWVRARPLSVPYYPPSCMADRKVLHPLMARNEVIRMSSGQASSSEVSVTLGGVSGKVSTSYESGTGIGLQVGDKKTAICFSDGEPVPGHPLGQYEFLAAQSG